MVTITEIYKCCECLAVGLVVGGAAVGIRDLFRYGLRVDQWRAHVYGRMSTSFKYLGGSLGLTVGTAVLASKIPGFVDLRSFKLSWVVIGSGCAIFGSWLICRHTPYEPRFLSRKHAAWAFHCGVVGSVVALLPSSRLPLLVAAGLFTVAIVGAYTIRAICLRGFANWNINWGPRMRIFYGIVFVSSVDYFISDNELRTGFGMVSVLYGLTMFSNDTLNHTQQLIDKAEATPRRAPFDPINEHMNLFWDSFWTFFCFLRFGSHFFS